MFIISKSAFLQLIKICPLVPADTNALHSFQSVWTLTMLPPWAHFLVTMLMGLLLPERQRTDVFELLLLAFGFLVVFFFFSLFMLLLINSEFLHLFNALLFFCLWSLQAMTSLVRMANQGLIEHEGAFGVTRDSDEVLILQPP